MTKSRWASIAGCRWRPWAAACLTLVLAGGLSGPGRAASSPLDFRLIYHAAQLSNQAYAGASEILGKYPGNAAWVATPGTVNVQYVLLHNDARRVQAIAVRGTVDDTNWDLDMDTRGVQDRKAGILMHRGFKTAAEAIYRDVRPRLKPGYATYLTGHSLGGAVATILGTYLVDDGYRIARIITFGQPKFTNLAGARAYAKLPLLRVINQNDTVAALPDTAKGSDQHYVHVGAAINLLSGPYYVYGSAEQALAISAGSLGRFLTRISIPDHSMDRYVHNLRGKLGAVQEVPFAERDKHILRQRPVGGGRQWEPIERRTNVNRRD